MNSVHSPLSPPRFSDGLLLLAKRFQFARSYSKKALFAFMLMREIYLEKESRNSWVIIPHPSLPREQGQSLRPAI